MRWYRSEQNRGAWRCSSLLRNRARISVTTESWSFILLPACPGKSHCPPSPCPGMPPPALPVPSDPCPDLERPMQTYSIVAGSSMGKLMKVSCTDLPAVRSAQKCFMAYLWQHCTQSVWCALKKTHHIGWLCIFSQMPKHLRLFQIPEWGKEKKVEVHAHGSKLFPS